MSFANRPITHTYTPAPGNKITKINFATYLNSDGKKSFVGIQFIGTNEQSPYFMGSYTSKITTYESISLNSTFVGFYGHLGLKYTSIGGIGAVMVRNINDELRQVNKDVQFYDSKEIVNSTTGLTFVHQNTNSIPKGSEIQKI